MKLTVSESTFIFHEIHRSMFTKRIKIDKIKIKFNYNVNFLFYYLNFHYCNPITPNKKTLDISIQAVSFINNATNLDVIENSKKSKKGHL